MMLRRRIAVITSLLVLGIAGWSDRRPELSWLFSALRRGSSRQHTD
jgi:hypothetical protein